MNNPNLIEERKNGDIFGLDDSDIPLVAIVFNREGMAMRIVPELFTDYDPPHSSILCREMIKGLLVELIARLDESNRILETAPDDATGTAN